MSWGGVLIDLGRDNGLAARLFASGTDYTLDGQKLTVAQRESA